MSTQINDIYYKRALEWYLEKYDPNIKENLLTLETIYKDSLKTKNKVWTNWLYLNNLILNFLSVHNNFKNPLRCILCACI
jgi:hypothetical protein